VSHCRGQPANARQPHDERGRHERRAHVTQGLSAGRSADTDSTKTVATASDVCMQARQLLSQLGLYTVADGTGVVAAALTPCLPALVLAEDWRPVQQQQQRRYESTRRLPRQAPHWSGAAAGFSGTLLKARQLLQPLV
jgi:hypothetical protein